MDMQTVSFRVSAEKVAALDALAASERRNRTYLLNEAIDLYLAVQEQRDRETLEAIAECDAGLTVPHEQVVAWVESLGTDNPLPIPRAGR